ncbi:hypothetical protein MMC24_005994 [Lignoscripta atroalba]|nr:hypothetical protein [Lignoscripta atroalba]
MNDVHRQYRKTAHYNVTHRRRQNFYALPSTQWQVLTAPPFNILGNLDRVDDAIDANADIATKILSTGLEAFGLDQEPSELAVDWRNVATPSDMDKARSTIRQLYRDWSAEGAAERAEAYGPVLQDLAQAFADTEDKSTIKVLVPGAGLGRLVLEICKLGYSAEGNEISYHQLITSSLVLNHVERGEQFDLYPFALTFSNHISREHQLRKVKVPDVHPGEELEGASRDLETHASERMSMTAADFVVLYGDERHQTMYDAVVTVFFVDTAPNVLRYIQVIRNCLKEGGLWINLGPLLWHFEERGPLKHKHDRPNDHTNRRTSKYTGIEEPGSVELTDEELLLLVESMGFEIEQHETRTERTGYIQNPESMIQNLYKVSHWIAKKAG